MEKGGKVTLWPCLELALFSDGGGGLTGTTAQGDVGIAFALSPRTCRGPHLSDCRPHFFSTQKTLLGKRDTTLGLETSPGRGGLPPTPRLPEVNYSHWRSCTQGNLHLFWSAQAPCCHLSEENRRGLGPLPPVSQSCLGARAHMDFLPSVLTWRMEVSVLAVTVTPLKCMALVMYNLPPSLLWSLRISLKLKSMQ